MKVTVCICTYNRANLLKDAIQSVLTQTFQEIEVVVLDNYSSDDTCDVVHSFNDPRITYVRHESNITGIGNWNYAINYVETEFFCILHDDDIMFPWMIEKELEVLIKHPFLGFVGSKPLLSCGVTQIPSYPRFITPVFYKHKEFIAELCRIGYNPLIISSVLFRKDIFKNNNLRFKPSILTDLYFWVECNLSHDFQMCIIEEPLFQYRVHGESETSKLFGLDKNLQFKDDARVLEKLLRKECQEFDLSRLYELFALFGLKLAMKNYCANLIDINDLNAERRRLEKECGWFLPDWRFEDKLAVMYFENLVLEIKAGRRSIGEYFDAIVEGEKKNIRASLKRNKIWFGNTYLRP